MNKLSVVLTVMVFVNGGCASDAERCNAAKVEAYDAWEAVAVARVRLAGAVVEESLPPDVGRAAAGACEEPRDGETFDAFDARCRGGVAPTPIVADCLQPRADESFDAFEVRCLSLPAAPPPAARRAPPSPHRETRFEAEQRVRLLANMARAGFTAGAAHARRIRDLARGGALAFRDAARGELAGLSDVDAPTRTRAEAATASHWERCSPVEP